MKYSEFLAEALLVRLLAYPELAGMEPDHRQEIGRLLIKKAASVKFQSSKRQIVMTFDLPGDDDETEIEPVAVEPEDPEMRDRRLDGLLDGAGNDTEPAEPDLSFERS